MKHLRIEPDGRGQECGDPAIVAYEELRDVQGHTMATQRGRSVTREQLPSGLLGAYLRDVEQPGRHRRSVERSASAPRKSESATHEEREIALVGEVQRVNAELAEERERRIALMGEVQRVLAELGEERARRISAEALAEERAEALALARRAARLRRPNPSVPTPERSLVRPTLPLRGNWLQ